MGQLGKKWPGVGISAKEGDDPPLEGNFLISSPAGGGGIPKTIHFWSLFDRGIFGHFFDAFPYILDFFGGQENN